jgi:long-chain acyl-CoA synthetase
VGYGTTECAPLISYSDYKDFIGGSCGTAVDHMEVRIDSPQPASVPGEILARGTNVMLGYFKNPEATAAAIDADGWYHTGDLATMDATGHIFIRGRSKNMLLGPSGQNIYPEEIEDRLNSMPMVSESLVVQRDNRLVALVHPDSDDLMNFGQDELQSIMEQNRQQLNEQLPSYSRLSAIELRNEEFAKTPKKSIKRYLYS